VLVAGLVKLRLREDDMSAGECMKEAEEATWVGVLEKKVPWVYCGFP
jgi:hypothetical protein